MSPKKKKPSPPQVRHTWKIRPQTRVKPSGKIYRRANRAVPDDQAANRRRANRAVPNDQAADRRLTNRRSTDWRRADAKKKPSWVSHVDWFGDRPPTSV